MMVEKIMDYYIYENWTHKRTMIHEGRCTFCNKGKGVHKGSTNKNGQWLGPFKNLKIAELTAIKLKRETTSKCSRCL